MHATTFRLAIKAGDPLPSLHRASLVDYAKKAWTSATDIEKGEGIAIFVPGVEESDLLSVALELSCFHLKDCLPSVHHDPAKAGCWSACWAIHLRSVFVVYGAP